MASKLIVLNNTLNGKFIVPMDKAKFHGELTNPRVAPDIETSIMIEFDNAELIKTSIVGEKAETQRFNFYRFDEDSENGIVWVETKGEEVFD
jgi:hypothetical protein